MSALVLNIITPHYHDEELDRRALNLNVVLALTFIVICLGIVAMLFQAGTRPLSYVLPNTAFIVVTGVVVAFCFYLSRTGRIQLASRLFVSMLTLACIGAIATGGTRGALPVVLLIPISTAGITLGNRASLLITGINTVALALVAALEVNGILHVDYPSTDRAIILNVVDVTFALFFVVMSIWLSSHSLQQALERTQRAVVDAEGFARTQQAQREHLEAIVERYRDYMSGITSGNLSARLDLAADGGSGDDPLLVLGHGLNDMVATLQDLILQVGNTAAKLNAGAVEILAATGQQVANAGEQSAAIGQTTTTVDEVKVIADQAVARAQEVADASHRTVEVAQAGRVAVQATVDSMNRIKDRVEVIADNILALSAQTQQIGNIISTVNDIAAQSNMLALNAAVEAARAGEHGKGFAVVAQEVRNLADQSRQATAQVRTILQEIQAATNSTVMATEEGNKGADEGVHLAAQAGQAIEQLAAVIDESAQAAVQMVAGGRQQATGIEQVALAMQSINQATAQSLASTRQAEQAARDLDTLARQLADVVKAYEL